MYGINNWHHWENSRTPWAAHANLAIFHDWHDYFSKCFTVPPGYFMRKSDFELSSLTPRPNSEFLSFLFGIKKKHDTSPMTYTVTEIYFATHSWILFLMMLTDVLLKFSFIVRKDLGFTLKKSVVRWKKVRKYNKKPGDNWHLYISPATILDLVNSHHAYPKKCFAYYFFSWFTLLGSIPWDVSSSSAWAAADVALITDSALDEFFAIVSQITEGMSFSVTVCACLKHNKALTGYCAGHKFEQKPTIWYRKKSSMHWTK